MKFFAVAAGIVVLGVLVLLAVQYVRYWNSPEYRAEVDLKNLEKQYTEDPYGGETPEETLRLFIDALKKGDTDLAAKYFVFDKQEQWKEDLGKIKEKGLLNDMIGDLAKAKKYRSSSEDQVFFTAGNEKGEAVATIDLVKIGVRWKIRGI